MRIFAIVYEVDVVPGKRELAGNNCLFTEEDDADRARDDWNRGFPHINSRSVQVASMEAK